MEQKLDLRIEKTYLSLRNAFTSLLEEKKFEDFTVSELCERAMIRRTTFYKHFADKYEYFTFYVREICAEFQSQLPPDITPDNLNDYFAHMCRELLRFIDDHKEMVNNVINSSLFQVLLDNMTDQIMYDVLGVLRQMKQTSAMSARQLEGIAAFYSGGLVNILHMALKHDGKLDEEHIIQTLAFFLQQK